MITLSIVIPAYNEEGGIAEITERVLAIRPDLEQEDIELLELLVVDDGSADKTAVIAKGVDGVQIISHAKNQGYGAALKTGFKRARGDLIGFLDADGTYPPEYFPSLCKAAINGAELVIGSRMLGADSQMPSTRRIGNLFFATLLSVIGWQKVSDSASGMRVFKRDVFDRVSPLPDGLNLTPVMSTRAIHEGISMAEVPIPYSERLGRSKLNVVSDGILFLHSMVWTVFTYNPVGILGIIGLGGIIMALIIGLALILARISGTTTLGPWGVAAVYFAMVSGVAGISIFALGTTFNYLVSLFYRRPIRQGLFGRPVFDEPLEKHFGWLGTLGLMAGLLLGGASMYLGLTGWEIARLWLYLLASAMLILIGVQLVISWILARALEELSKREYQVLDGAESKLNEEQAFVS